MIQSYVMKLASDLQNVDDILRVSSNNKTTITLTQILLKVELITHNSSLYPKSHFQWIYKTHKE